MAVMSDTDRKRARTWFLRILQEAAQEAGFSKAELDAALAAADSWADSNSASYNTALPQPFRGAADANMKALLLAAVCMRRAGLARTSED